MGNTQGEAKPVRVKVKRSREMKMLGRKRYRDVCELPVWSLNEDSTLSWLDSMERNMKRRFEERWNFSLDEDRPVEGQWRWEERTEKVTTSCKENAGRKDSM